VNSYPAGSLDHETTARLEVAKDSHTGACVESNCGIEYTHYVDVRGLDAFLTPYVPPTSPV